jgi:hypothetical protein
MHLPTLITAQLARQQVVRLHEEAARAHATGLSNRRRRALARYAARQA